MLQHLQHHFDDIDKPAVLLMHGLYSNDLVWFANEPNSSLPFMLAEAGYDVWLGSSRATHSSEQHLFFTDKDWQYWDYSLEDIGMLDLPAFINFILGHTGKESLSYISHSLGGTNILLGASL